MPVAKVEGTKVITGMVRFSYVNVFNARSFDANQDEKYSLCLIIDKKDKDTIKAINQAIEAAKEIGKNSKWGGKIPKNIKLPLRDGEEREDEAEEYQGKMFVNASSKTKPGIIDKNKNEILDSTEVYSGCYGRASLNFYPFESNGNKGVAVGLNNVQMLKDGEPLGAARQSAEDDFDDLDDEDDLLD